jgi:hypothetical protein
MKSKSKQRLAVGSSDWLGLWASRILKLLQRAGSAKRASEARELTSACKNLVIGLAILLDDPARLNALVRGNVVKSHGEKLITARHKSNLLAAIPNRSCGAVVSRNLVARPISKRDKNGVGARNVHDVSRHRHRPNETEVSYRHRERAVLEVKRF